MKIIVTEFPCEPRLCIFGQYDAQYDVVECKIPCAQGYECTDTFKCPYLIAFMEIYPFMKEK